MEKVGQPDQKADAIAVTASQWLSRKDAGLSKTEEAELARWLGADPRRDFEFTRLDAAWKSLQQLQKLGIGDSPNRLVFDRTPLSSAIRLFNQRNKVKMVLGDGLSDILIAGRFRADKIDEFVQFLGTQRAIVAEKPDATRIMLRRSR